MSQTKCPTFEDKLNAIEVWMEETEDAVSSQDSYKEDALTPEAIDLILRYASYVSSFVHECFTSSRLYLTSFTTLS